MKIGGVGLVGVRRVCAVIAIVVAVSLVIGVSAASASKEIAATFGQGGSGAGAFDTPSGIAVNQALGDVYVADGRNQFGAISGGHRLEQFTAEGDFVRAWGWGVATGASAFELCTSSCQAGVSGPGVGQFALQAWDDSGSLLITPQVAVDQSDGSVYVADPGNDRIQKFSSSGAFLVEFGTSGTGDGQFDLPQGIAVDPVSGDVYVADSNNNRVQRFTSAGVYESQIGSLAGELERASSRRRSGWRSTRLGGCTCWTTETPGYSASARQGSLIRCSP